MKILRMVHIKKKEKKRKEILKKKKKKINSDVGRKPKQEMWVYRKKHTMVGAFRRARLHMSGREHLAVGGGGPSGMQGADRVMAKWSCLKTILPGLYLVRL